MGEEVKERIALIAMGIAIITLLMIAVAAVYWAGIMMAGKEASATLVILAFVCWCAFFGVLEYFRRP